MSLAHRPQATKRPAQIDWARDCYVISRFEQAALHAGTATAEVEARLAEHVRLYLALCVAGEAKCVAWETYRLEELMTSSEARQELSWSAMKVQLAGGQQAAPFTVEDLEQLFYARVITNVMLAQLLNGDADAGVLGRCRGYLAAWHAQQQARRELGRFQHVNRTEDLPPDLRAALERIEDKRRA